MKVNYHTHTYRCNHAEGTEREYIEAAIEGGLTKLGFSDHSPYPFADGYESPIRMKVSEFEGYVKTLEELKNEYRNDIEIHIGLEAEYYPRFFDNLLKLIEPYPVEYLLLGQHFLQNEMDGGAIPAQETDSEQVLIDYVDQTAEALATGKFLYFAHPDLVHFVGDAEIYNREMGRLLDNAEKFDIPLEINLLGIALNRHYPTDAFWKLVSGRKIRVCLGTDAHKKHMVINPECEKKALELVKRYDLNLVEDVLA